MTITLLYTTCHMINTCTCIVLILEHAYTHHMTWSKNHMTDHTHPQELQTEVEDKSHVVNAMASTAENIVEEMESKGTPPGEIADQMADIQLKWESLKMKLDAKREEFSVVANRFNSFLDSFGAFVNWLSEFYGMLYDEVCVQIPTRASDGTIAHHRAKLEVSESVMITLERVHHTH